MGRCGGQIHALGVRPRLAHSIAQCLPIRIGLVINRAVASGIMAWIKIGVHEKTLIPASEVLPDPGSLCVQSVGFQTRPEVRVIRVVEDYLATVGSEQL